MPKRCPMTTAQPNAQEEFKLLPIAPRWEITSDFSEQEERQQFSG